jgi:hypothetical protein
MICVRRHNDGTAAMDTPNKVALLVTDAPAKRALITWVNTQNLSVTKIVDSSSIQCAESKYDLRIQFLALVVMIHEVWLYALNYFTH